jgi:hypothetical protein
MDWFPPDMLPRTSVMLVLTLHTAKDHARNNNKKKDSAHNISCANTQLIFGNASKRPNYITSQCL